MQTLQVPKPLNICPTDRDLQLMAATVGGLGDLFILLHIIS